MNAILNKVFSVLLNILITIVVIFLIFAVYNFIQLEVLKKDYVNYFGYTYFNTISGSMEDTINIDDYVIVKITKNVLEDDIVTFKDDNMIVTHRIVRVDDKKIVTKGDANNVEDEPISKKQIIGKVVFVARNIGKYIKVITEPIVFIPFFITILLFNFAFSGSEKKRSGADEKKISSSEEN